MVALRRCMERFCRARQKSAWLKWYEEHGRIGQRTRERFATSPYTLQRWKTLLPGLPSNGCHNRLFVCPLHRRSGRGLEQLHCRLKAGRKLKTSSDPDCNYCRENITIIKRIKHIKIITVPLRDPLAVYSTPDVPQNKSRH